MLPTTESSIVVCDDGIPSATSCIAVLRTTARNMGRGAHGGADWGGREMPSVCVCPLYRRVSLCVCATCKGAAQPPADRATTTTLSFRTATCQSTLSRSSLATDLQAKWMIHHRCLTINPCLPACLCVSLFSHTSGVDAGTIFNPRGLNTGFSHMAAAGKLIHSGGSMPCNPRRRVGLHNPPFCRPLFTHTHTQLRTCSLSFLSLSLFPRTPHTQIRTSCSSSFLSLSLFHAHHTHSPGHATF
jgi:hypothetical protein